jgi:PadR family transcriptional regulator, regulatory protein PadR
VPVGGDESRGSRLLRGILDACLLALVVERDRYGYELATALHAAGLPIVKQGSIYPLLSRLERRGLLESYRTPAAGGPPRRYYRITTAGRHELAAAHEVWTEVSAGVDAVIGRQGNDVDGDTTDG